MNNNAEQRNYLSSDSISTGPLTSLDSAAVPDSEEYAQVRQTITSLASSNRKVSVAERFRSFGSGVGFSIDPNCAYAKLDKVKAQSKLRLGKNKNGGPSRSNAQREFSTNDSLDQRTSKKLAGNAPDAYHDEDFPDSLNLSSLPDLSRMDEGNHVNRTRNGNEHEEMHQLVGKINSLSSLNVVGHPNPANGASGINNTGASGKFGSNVFSLSNSDEITISSAPLFDNTPEDVPTHEDFLVNLKPKADENLWPEPERRVLDDPAQRFRESERASKVVSLEAQCGKHIDELKQLHVVYENTLQKLETAELYISKLWEQLQNSQEGEEKLTKRCAELKRALKLLHDRYMQVKVHSEEMRGDLSAIQQDMLQTQNECDRRDNGIVLFSHTISQKLAEISTRVNVLRTKFATLAQASQAECSPNVSENFFNISQEIEKLRNSIAQTQNQFADAETYLAHVRKIFNIFRDAPMLSEAMEKVNALVEDANFGQINPQDDSVLSVFLGALSEFRSEIDKKQAELDKITYKLAQRDEEMNKLEKLVLEYAQELDSSEEIVKKLRENAQATQSDVHNYEKKYITLAKSKIIC